MNGATRGDGRPGSRARPGDPIPVAVLRRRRHEPRSLLSLGFAYASLARHSGTLATVERIPEGDGEAWITEWSAVAGRLASQAEDA